MTNSVIYAIFFGVIMATICTTASVADVPKMQEEDITLSTMANAIPGLMPLNGTYAFLTVDDDYDDNKEDDNEIILNHHHIRCRIYIDAYSRCLYERF